MCGITGIFSAREAPDMDLVRSMTARLVHRGPTEEGYHFAPPVALGMRRLSIIDLQGGQQPVFNEDRSIAVIFNGEIYNYVELARELEACGHRFYTRSDTEVIAHLYEEHGPQCLGRLNGMFAIALWDAKRQELLLARDRLGVKPLYVADGGRQIAFASELKSLLLCPFVSREVDPDAVAEYLALMYVRAPHTPFRTITKLLPGHFMVIGRDGMRTTRWWSLHDHCGKAEISRKNAGEKLREILEDAVRLRLRSDVPVGTFLSGGLDSSAVTGLAANLRSDPLNTYAVGFADTEFNELGYAKVMTDAFHTRHRELIVHASDAWQHLPRLVWHLDEPHGDSAIVPTFLVSQLAAQELRVVLSGLGGDELFGGYPRYFDGGRWQHAYRRCPPWLRSGLLTPLASLMGPAVRDRVRRNNLSDADRYLDRVSVFPLAARSAMLAPGRNGAVTFAGEFGAYPGDDAANRMMFVDALTYLPDDILHLTDRMSMAVSLEVRTPFLDYRLVEFAASLPGSFKLDQRRHLWKLCLKEAVTSLLPPEILTRPKWGFGAPVAGWLSAGLGQIVEALFRDPVVSQLGLIDRRAAQAYIHQAVESKGTGYAQPLWTLMMLELWGRVFVGGGGEPPAFSLPELME